MSTLNTISMKKLIFLILLFLSIFSFNSIGQIKVFNNNNVGINWNTTPASRFVINATGNSAYEAWIFRPVSSTTGAALATISAGGTGTSRHIICLLSQTAVGSSDYLYGIKANAYSSTVTIGRTYGLYGEAGNAQGGFNYGAYGYLHGTTGAAIFGTIDGYGDIGLTAAFAGYFRGDVKCESIIYATSFQTLSDEKFKTNIKDLDAKVVTSNFLKISPKQYNLKQVEIEQKSADSTSITKLYKESVPLFTKAKYGVLAQELQKLFPDLVYQDNTGNLTVEYTGLIPIMVSVIQSQEEKITVLSGEIDLLAKKIELLQKK
jgi:hypothetical protein